MAAGRGHRRRGGAAGWRRLAGFAALIGGAGAAAAVPGTAPCRLEGVEHEAQCGVVQRPLDPDRPGGARIDVHFAVLPALSRQKKPDPLFFFAGGPGQSAIDLAGPLSRQFARLLNRRDVVLIDQRGTGRSAPLKCDAAAPLRPVAELVDPRRQVERIAHCRVALQKLAWGDLAQFTTSIAVADADAVRQALGVPQVNIAGGSYGTRFALEYLRRFPQAVRRTVIDGVAPPDMVLPASFSTDNQAALDAVLAGCEADPDCRSRHPQLRVRWQALLAGAPRQVTVRHPLTGRAEVLPLDRGTLLGLVRPALYLPAMAALLPLAIDEAAEGRYEALIGAATALDAGPAGRMAEGMHFSVVCSEDVPRMPAATDRPGADFGDTFAAMYREICAAWPRGRVPDAFYTVPRAATPVLLLSGGADPVTPPRHAERVAAALGPKARTTVVGGAGHGVMALPCLRDAIFRFIDADSDADALATDVGCAAAVPRPRPFIDLEPPR